ncbi:MAG: carboxypeptidase-like regulatory domain-containing protein [Chitinophagales bacterium]
MNNIFLVLACFASNFIYSQHTINITIKDAKTKDALIGVNVELKTQNKGSITDLNGQTKFNDIATGLQNIFISYIGYETIDTSIIIESNTELVFNLNEEETELDEVTVASTRTSRNMSNTPTRIENIELEEIDEKSNMRPANVSMLLHESTGIQVQQTSATSANASIRIQGLDGRYTQLLKDGIPNFGNFASGLSVMEIPPLDLQS